MLLNVQQQFGPSDFLRQIQSADIPTRNNIAYVADEDFKIKKDIADFRNKLNGQLMNEVIHCRQDNTQLRLMLGDHDHSAQRVVHKLQKDIETLSSDNQRLWNQLQRSLSNPRKADTCYNCIELQLKTTDLAQQLQTERDRVQQLQKQLAESHDDIRKIQKDNSLLNRKVTQLKQKQIRNIEEYNQLIQSYTHLNSDNEAILQQYDKLSKRQVQKEQQLKVFTARIEDINCFLKGAEGRSPDEISTLELDTIVVEVEKRIQQLQTKYQEQTMETEQLATKLSEKEAFYRRVSDEYTEAVEQIQLFKKVESVYKEQMQQIRREVKVREHKQANSNTSPVNVELVQNIQQLDHKLVVQTKKNQDLTLQLNSKNQQIKDLQSELEQSDIELQKTLRALEEKRQIIKRLQDENDSLQAKINNMLNNEGNKKSEDEYYQQQIARLNDQIKALSANQAALKQQIQILSQSLQQEKQTSAQSQQLSSRLQDSLSNANDQIHSLNNQLQRIIQELNRVYAELENLRNQRQEDIIVKQTDQRNWQAETDQLQTTLRQLAQENQQLNSIIIDCNHKIAHMESYIRNQEKTFREQTELLDKQKTEERKNFEEKLTHSLHRQIENKREAEFFKKKLKEAEDYITELQKENDTVKEAVEQLKDRVTSLSVEVAGLNDKLVVTTLDNELLVKQLEEMRQEEQRQRENNRQQVIAMQQTIDQLQTDLQNAVKQLGKKARSDTAAAMRGDNTILLVAG